MLTCLGTHLALHQSLAGAFNISPILRAADGAACEAVNGSCMPSGSDTCLPLGFFGQLRDLLPAVAAQAADDHGKDLIDADFCQGCNLRAESPKNFLPQHGNRWLDSRPGQDCLHCAGGNSSDTRRSGAARPQELISETTRPGRSGFCIS